MQVAKAHAYGNDFLFVPTEQVEGLRLDELSRRLCDRHSGLGGDGVIYYTIAPDGSAHETDQHRRQPVGAVGQRPALSGGPRAASAREIEASADQRSRVDTDAGWKTLSLIARQGSRYTFRAAMGSRSASNRNRWRQPARP